MKKYRFYLIALIIITWFFEGLLRVLIGNYGKLITEGVLVAGGVFALLSKKRIQKKNMTLILSLLLSIGWIALSCIALKIPVLTGLVYYRQLFWILGFLLLLWAIPLDETESYKLVILCFLLMAFEILLSSVLFALGHREEYIVGTLCSTGGELATVFSLIGISLLIGAGIFVKKTYLFLFPAGFMIGLASGKRAIFAFVPVFIAILLITIGIKLKRSKAECKKDFSKALRTFVLVFFILLPVFPYAINQVKFEIGDVDLDRVDLSEYLYEVFVNYVTGTGKEYETVEGDSASRVQNLIIGMKESFSNAEVFFFGIGADAFQTSENDTKKLQLGMYYGIVGWSNDSLSNGVPFALLILLFYCLLLKRVLPINFDSLSPWGKAALASYYGFFITFIIIHFCYGDSFVRSPLVMCLMVLYPELLVSMAHPAETKIEATENLPLEMQPT